MRAVPIPSPPPPPQDQVLEVLDRVRLSLAEPASWTKGAYARRFDGSRTYPHDPGAACWCVIGAVRRACFGASDRVLDAVHASLYRAAAELWRSRDSATRINDYSTTTHRDVLNWIDTAIANRRRAA